MKNKIIENIIFDFDGVILDSLNCKTQAFYSMFLKYGDEIANEVKSYHLDNGGVSRFEKFKYWYKLYFNKTLEEKEINKLANSYSKLVVDKVIMSKEIPGSLDFIKNNHDNFKFFIISGTPHDEINLIAKEIEIYKYFIEILGSPKNKIYWSKYLIEKYNLEPKKTLFIGDANSDFEAAKFHGFKFALRLADYNKKKFEKTNCFKFQIFQELIDYLK